MKIGIISTMNGSAWTGSEELWAALVPEALREGHQVAVSLWRWPEVPAPVRALQKQGARVLFRKRHSGGPTVNSVLSRLTDRSWNLPAPGALSGFRPLFRERPDVLLLSQGWTYEFRDNPDLVARLYASKTPLVVLNQANFEGTISRQMRRDTLPFFERAARVAFVARGNLRAAERQLATALPHALVVRNPVNLKELGKVAWPSKAPNREETWDLACVGRLDCPHKGQDVLLEALSTRQWRGRSWKLRFFGTGSNDETSYIRTLIAFYGLENHVELAGYQADVRAIWATHHLLVMPSRIEGTPLALVEAMLCGRAALATDIAGHAEWIEPNRSGFLAEAPSAPSLGAALERAWQARHSWRAMGEAAHHAATERYDLRPGKTLLDLLTAAATGAAATGDSREIAPAETPRSPAVASPAAASEVLP